MNSPLRPRATPSRPHCKNAKRRGLFRQPGFLANDFQPRITAKQSKFRKRERSAHAKRPGSSRAIQLGLKFIF